MFSPACSWASSHRTWPASSCNSTSDRLPCGRRVKDPSVYMTLSGWEWGWVRSPGRSRYSSTRTRSFSKTTDVEGSGL